MHLEEASEEPGSPVVALWLVGCVYDDAYAVVGPRRSFASKAIALHAWEYFQKWYKLEFSREGKITKQVV